MHVSSQMNIYNGIIFIVTTMYVTAGWPPDLESEIPGDFQEISKFFQ